MLQTTFSRKGGKAKSARKTKANRAKASAYWKSVRSGEIAPPRRHRRPPTEDKIRKNLAPYCRRHGITQLELFGSIARGEGGLGSDVDLIATFRVSPGLDFFSMEEEMSKILGAPVHLLISDSVQEMSNYIRRESILRDARIIYRAQSRTGKS